MSLLIFGMGYTARALLHAWPASDPVDITVTTRSADKAERLRAEGLTVRLFPGDDLGPDLAQARRVLITAGPEDGRDPVLSRLGHEFARARHLEWIGYLSTTSVYGDHGGAWVDETTPCAPDTDRGRARVTAEDAWCTLHREHGLPVHVFRLAGIYGPGRSPLDRLRAGTARRIVKPGQVFSRIHVQDIARVLLASMARPNPGAVYNVCDDAPAPPQDVIAHAATLMGLAPPPEVPFDTAELGPMARSFYAESKRVRNDRIKTDLGVRLAYPDYRAGLAGILASESFD